MHRHRKKPCMQRCKVLDTIAGPRKERHRQRLSAPVANAVQKVASKNTTAHANTIKRIEAPFPLSYRYASTASHSTATYDAAGLVPAFCPKTLEGLCRITASVTPWGLLSRRSGRQASRRPHPHSRACPAHNEEVLNPTGHN